jgi:hypothetical protein
VSTVLRTLKITPYKKIPPKLTIRTHHMIHYPLTSYKHPPAMPSRSLPGDSLEAWLEGLRSQRLK